MQQSRLVFGLLVCDDVPAVAGDSCRVKCPVAFSCRNPRLSCGSSPVGGAASILLLTAPQAGFGCAYRSCLQSRVGAVHCSLHAVPALTLRCSLVWVAQESIVPSCPCLSYTTSTREIEAREVLKETGYMSFPRRNNASPEQATGSRRAKKERKRKSNDSSFPLATMYTLPAHPPPTKPLRLQLPECAHTLTGSSTRMPSPSSAARLQGTTDWPLAVVPTGPRAASTGTKMLVASRRPHSSRLTDDGASQVQA